MSRQGYFYACVTDVTVAADIYNDYSRAADLFISAKKQEHVACVLIDTRY